MRLRLDKLVLSAGLALAMVATTIPVGAAITKSGDTVTAVAGYMDANGNDKGNDLSALTVTGEEVTVDTGLKSETKTKYTTEAGTQVDASYAKTKDSAYNYKSTVIASDQVKKVETVTYTLTDYVVNYAIDPSTTSTTPALSSNNEEAVIKAIAGETNVASGIKVEVTDPLTYTQDSNDSTKTKVSGEITKTTTTEVSELPSGYQQVITFSSVQYANDYIVYEYDEDTYEKIVPEVATDGTPYIVTTNANKSYILGSRTVSAKGALLFEATNGDSNQTTVTNAGYTATVTAVTDTVGSGVLDVSKVEDLPSDAAVAGYFTITVAGGSGVVIDTGDTALTFRIAKPKDVTASTWYVATLHTDADNNKTYSLIPATLSSDGNYIEFSTSKFSTFALVYSATAADTTEEETNNETNNETETESATEAGTETTTAGTSTTSTTTSTKTADNSMIPLFMTTLLLALCAGSLAIYKEKKTY